MRKRMIGILTAGMLLFSLVGCGNDIIVDVVTNENQGAGSQTANTDTSEKQENTGNEGNGAESPKTNPAGLATIAAEDLKVGVLYIGSASDTSGYTYAHEIGIQGMVANLGLSDSQVIRKEFVDDTDTEAITKALDECIKEGCNVIFTTSWGYMEKTAEYADMYPDIYFAHGTGYMSNGKNFTNYFGRIYQARYLSGIVAGLKTKSNRIGFVSAMGSENSECTGGIDAFAMGVESVNPDAKVLVAVTNSWFSPEDEQTASDALIAEGCDVLAQHVDTTAPQKASEANGTWAIGYNSDMSKEAPDSVLCSVIWTWSAYYTEAVQSIINGTWDGENYYGGLAEGLVGITDTSDFCNPECDGKVAEATQKMLDGSFNVFDGVIETNTGETVGEEGSTLSDAEITGGIDWYFKTVTVLE